MCFFVVRQEKKTSTELKHFVLGYLHSAWVLNLELLERGINPARQRNPNTHHTQVSKITLKSTPWSKFALLELLTWSGFNQNRNTLIYFSPLTFEAFCLSFSLPELKQEGVKTKETNYIYGLGCWIQAMQNPVKRKHKSV